MERRTFILAAGASAAAVRNAAGANERINLAIVGLGGRGMDHLKEYLKQPTCRVAALCEIDSARLEKAETSVYQQTNEKPKGYRDMREAFNAKDIDAVSIVTPNHWHALAAIWACQAGKDVYSEKPASHNLFEGRQMVEAARKYKRVVQIGHQSRSTAHKIQAVEALQKGVIGQVYLAKGLCYKRRKTIGKVADSEVPPGVDWDKFLGPAPKRPFNKNRFHYNWHWFWDTGNGDIGNQGVHEMDIARWGLGKTGFPKTVTSTGGKFVYDDDQETPNTQTAVFDYGDVQIQFEVRGLISPEEGGLLPRGSQAQVSTIGNIFFGSEGYLVVDASGYQVYKGETHEKVQDVKVSEASLYSTAPHIENFLAGCRSRKIEDLHCDVDTGRKSAAFCHMANISYRLGGKKLSFNEASEQFDDAEANKLSTRAYRDPYVVPTQV